VAKIGVLSRKRGMRREVKRTKDEVGIRESATREARRERGEGGEENYEG